MAGRWSWTRYREYTGQALDDESANGDAPQDTWVALMHRPGPAAPATGPLVEDPRFAEHVAFLTRMRDAGYLVAAGPMGDRAGEGMTILRLPGADQLATATRLATEDDASVVSGLLAVTVRWWQPIMQANTLKPWCDRILRATGMLGPRRLFSVGTALTKRTGREDSPHARPW